VPRLNVLALPPEVARTIEDLAMRAWPARLVRPLHGWRLAFGDGLTRRINSVQAVEWDGGAGLEEAIRQVERFYAEHGLPPRFRVTAVSRPEGLDSCLAGRGYEIEAPTDVLVAAAAPSRFASTRHTVTIAKAAPPDWRELWLAQGGEDERSRRQALLGRLPPGAIFALAHTDSRSSGIGLAVVEHDWAGIFAMCTARRFRGQGVARAVLDALMGQAAASGTGRFYIQVEQDNDPAQRLYRGAGFAFAYSYHYRTSRSARRG
jgi:N-acetylglutamate synthase